MDTNDYFNKDIPEKPTPSLAGTAGEDEKEQKAAGFWPKYGKYIIAGGVVVGVAVGCYFLFHSSSKADACDENVDDISVDEEEQPVVIQTVPIRETQSVPMNMNMNSSVYSMYPSNMNQAAPLKISGFQSPRALTEHAAASIGVQLNGVVEFITTVGGAGGTETVQASADVIAFVTQDDTATISDFQIPASVAHSMSANSLSYISTNSSILDASRLILRLTFGRQLDSVGSGLVYTAKSALYRVSGTVWTTDGNTATQTDGFDGWVAHANEDGGIPGMIRTNGNMNAIPVENTSTRVVHSVGVAAESSIMRMFSFIPKLSNGISPFHLLFRCDLMETGANYKPNENKHQLFFSNAAEVTNVAGPGAEIVDVQFYVNNGSNWVAATDDVTNTILKAPELSFFDGVMQIITKNSASSIVKYFYIKIVSGNQIEMITKMSSVDADTDIKTMVGTATHTMSMSTSDNVQAYIDAGDQEMTVPFIATANIVTTNFRDGGVAPPLDMMRPVSFELNTAILASGNPYILRLEYEGQIMDFQFTGGDLIEGTLNLQVNATSSTTAQIYIMEGGSPESLVVIARGSAVLDYATQFTTIDITPSVVQTKTTVNLRQGKLQGVLEIDLGAGLPMEPSDTGNSGTFTLDGKVYNFTKLGAGNWYTNPRFIMRMSKLEPDTNRPIESWTETLNLTETMSQGANVTTTGAGAGDLKLWYAQFTKNGITKSVFYVNFAALGAVRNTQTNGYLYSIESTIFRGDVNAGEVDMMVARREEYTMQSRTDLTLGGVYNYNTTGKFLPAYPKIDGTVTYAQNGNIDMRTNVPNTEKDITFMWSSTYQSSALFAKMKRAYSIHLSTRGRAYLFGTTGPQMANELFTFIASDGADSQLETARAHLFTKNGTDVRTWSEFITYAKNEILRYFTNSADATSYHNQLTAIQTQYESQIAQIGGPLSAGDQFNFSQPMLHYTANRETYAPAIEAIEDYRIHVSNLNDIHAIVAMVHAVVTDAFTNRDTGVAQNTIWANGLDAQGAGAMNFTAILDSAAIPPIEIGDAITFDFSDGIVVKLVELINNSGRYEAGSLYDQKILDSSNVRFDTVPSDPEIALGLQVDVPAARSLSDIQVAGMSVGFRTGLASGDIYQQITGVGPEMWNTDTTTKTMLFPLVIRAAHENLLQQRFIINLADYMEHPLLVTSTSEFTNITEGTNDTRVILSSGTSFDEDNVVVVPPPVLLFSLADGTDVYTNTTYTVTAGKKIPDGSVVGDIEYTLLFSADGLIISYEGQSYTMIKDIANSTDIYYKPVAPDQYPVYVRFKLTASSFNVIVNNINASFNYSMFTANTWSS